MFKMKSRKGLCQKLIISLLETYPEYRGLASDIGRAYILSFVAGLRIKDSMIRSPACAGTVMHGERTMIQSFCLANADFWATLLSLWPAILQTTWPKLYCFTTL